MTERPIIISVLRQALDGITDTSLLGFVKLCRREFDDIIVKFNYLHESQSEGFIPEDDGQLRNMASNQNGAE